MIYLHENGVTVVADKKARVGQKYNLNGQEYTVVDRKLLKNLVSSGFDLSKVVTTRVKIMRNLFDFEKKFNQDISSWDVSNVESMSRMFAYAKNFNQDISKWDVSKVYNFEYMFDGALTFNSDISSWKLKSSVKLTGMFSSAYAFNQPVGKWNINFSFGSDIAYMFMNAKSFNQCLNNWNVGEIRSFISLFEGAESFNQDLNSWNVNGSLNRMFKNAKKFNGDISSWKLNVSLMEEMFFGATSFNQDISGWDVSKVVNMDRMFNGAVTFNQNLSYWDINPKLKFKKPSGIFVGAKNFNLALSPFEKKVQNNLIKKKKNENLIGVDNNSFLKIKNLLQSRDYSKIDLAIELIKSLNSFELYNTLVNGCKLETSFNDEHSNHFDSILHTNVIFTGTGPAQPFLNYALMNIITCIPDDKNIVIDDSLMLKNINRLNINTILKKYSNNYIEGMFRLDDFHNLNKLIIDFSDFKGINFDNVFKNEYVTEIKVRWSDSFKWFSNFKQIKKLEIVHSRNDVYNLEDFKTLSNLEEYFDYNQNNDLIYLSNCKSLKKLVIKSPKSNEIEALSNLNNLEDLEIIGIQAGIDLSPIGKCLKLKKICFKPNYGNYDRNQDFNLLNIDFSPLENCKSLDSITISNDYDYQFKGKLKMINGENIISNINVIKINGLEIVNDENNIIVEKKLIHYSSDMINHIKVKKNLNDNMEKLNSEPIDNKLFLRIKKLLEYRDYDKIDLAIELIKSLNNYHLYNNLLKGCKLEVYDGVRYPSGQIEKRENYFESILHTNKLFTGTGPAQPFLNYGLISIIAITPKDKNIKIHKSIKLENIDRLNLVSLKLKKMFRLKNFNSLNKLIIDFKSISGINFDEKFSNESISELITFDVFGSLKWLNNLNNLKYLTLNKGYNKTLSNFEVLKTLNNLEFLKLDCSDDFDLNMLSYYKELQTLILINPKRIINNDTLKKLTNLEYLEYRYNSDNELKIINLNIEISNFYGLTEFKNLKTIQINGIQLLPLNEN